MSIRSELASDVPFLLDGSASVAASGPAEMARPGALRKRPKLPPAIVAAAFAPLDFILVLVTVATVTPHFQALNNSGANASQYWATGLVSAIAFVAIFERFGGYRLPRRLIFFGQISQIVLAWALAASLLFTVALVGQLAGYYSPSGLAVWLLATPVALLAGRSLAHLAILQWLGDLALAPNIIVVGAGEEAEQVVAKLVNDRGDGIVVAGIFDDAGTASPRFIHGIPVLGTTDDLLQYARRESVHQIIVALPLETGDELEAILEKLSAIATEVRLSVAPLAERFSVRGIDDLAGIPLFEIAARPLKAGAALCKWLEDKLIAALLLVFLGPLCLFIAGLIKLDSRGPIIFVQKRFGYNNCVIRVLKFRTMYADRGDPSGARRTVQRDPRVTRVGRVLRSLSLDELPQLFNVLCGDMSLVGPRPHAIEMRAGDRLYHEAVARYAHRHRVKPGITGWAQVSGFRGEVDTFEKARGRVECDLHYIDNWSLWLDIKIMLMTLGLLFSRADAY
jgi:Undecaprenyl-phosphate glucose phosphotransferase